MYDSVRNAFIAVTVPIEGKVNHMYCDTKRLVTTGIGVMLPNAAAAQQLSWRWRDTNKKATAAEIAAEWTAVRWIGQQGTANKSAAFFAKYAQLMLPDTEITRSCLDKLNELEAEALNYLPDSYRNWPADAQMAVLQLVWNIGPNMFNPKSNAYWPNLSAALKKQDWLAAAQHSSINGATTRNVLTKRLFNNANLVVERWGVKSKFYNEIEPPKPVILDEQVKYGKTNNEIKKLQRRLAGLGYPIIADGQYGPQTKATVTNYQKRNNLFVDGIAGPKTLTALGFVIN